MAKKLKVIGLKPNKPRPSESTIERINRNILAFYCTEEQDVRRATRSDNMTMEKLRAKYATLKTKINLTEDGPAPCFSS